MPRQPRILNVRTVARSRLFRIEAVGLRFDNGVEVEFERLRGGSTISAVIVVPMLDADTVLLIREYGVGLERYELGLPKGRADEGESLLQAANRELMEEAGYGARELIELPVLSLAPAYLGHRTQVVLARDLYPKRLPGDEPEPLEVIPWRLSRIEELLLDGDELSEGRSIAALYMARSWLMREARTRPPQPSGD
jgi:ADP-ribose diphosphatase